MSESNLSTSVKRNEGLDALRLVAAFMVCIQHTITSVGVFGYVLMLTRIAVPVFLMITGFYIYNTKLKKQMLKILKIILVMTVLYFCFDLAKFLALGKLSYFWGQFADVENWFKLIVFNSPIVADHGWYLFALLYALPIVHMLVHRNNKIVLICVFAATYTFCILCGKYSVLVFGMEFPAYIVRSFLGMGIPFLILGYFVNVIFKSGGICARRFSHLFLLIAVAISILERYLLETFHVNGTRDVYISTALLAVAVFMWFYLHADMFAGSKIPKMGLKYSLYIYIVHIAFREVFEFGCERIGFTNEYLLNIIEPTVIIVLSFITAVVYYFVFDKYVKRRIERLR